MYASKVASVSDERIQKLRSLKSFVARKAFCDQNFPKIGAGSSRIAYDYSPDFVLKLAKNAKGIAQNNAESDGFLQQSEIIPKILDEDEVNNHWLIVEKCPKINEAIFQAITGFSFDSFKKFMMYKHSLFVPGKVPDRTPEIEAMDENEIFGEIVELMGSAQLGVGDLCRISSYGQSKGKLKLIDAGLTQTVEKEHYK